MRSSWKNPIWIEFVKVVCESDWVGIWKVENLYRSAQVVHKAPISCVKDSLNLCFMPSSLWHHCILAFATVWHLHRQMSDRWAQVLSSVWKICKLVYIFVTSLQMLAHKTIWHPQIQLSDNYLTTVHAVVYNCLTLVHAVALICLTHTRACAKAHTHALAHTVVYNCLAPEYVRYLSDFRSRQ